PREPAAPRRRGGARRGDRRRGSAAIRQLAPLARRGPDHCRAPQPLRRRSPLRAAATGVEARGAASRSAQPGGRDHAADHREAAAAADRTAEERGRRAAGGAVHGDAHAAVRSRCRSRVRRRTPRNVRCRAGCHVGRKGRRAGPEAVRIGTRGSALALWQARTVARLIREAGGPECEIVVIRTSGDEKSGPPDPPRPPEATARPAGPEAPQSPTSADPATSADTAAPTNVKRAFVKEIEDALLHGQVDVAVHSAKDLPGTLPDGLFIAAVLEREDPRDALLMPSSHLVNGMDAIVTTLGESPRIGTSSVRRTAQLRAAFPAAEFVPIRGNVDTRLRKLDQGECDVLVLAAAGVKRLGVQHRLSAYLPADLCMP